MIRFRWASRWFEKGRGPAWFDRLRNSWSQQSLTVKLFLTMSLVIFLIVAAGSLAVMNLSRNVIADTSVTKALYHIQLLKTKLLETMLSDDSRHEGLEALLQSGAVLNAVSEINIFDREGKISYSTRKENLKKFVPPVSEEKVRFASDDAMIEMNELRKNERLRMIHPIHGSSKCAACHANASGGVLGGVELYVPLQPVYRHFSINRMAFVTAAFVIVLLGAFLIRWLVHSIVKRPIKKLIHVMEKAERGELDVRTRIKEDPELRRLAHRFNAMVRGIRQAQKKIEAQHQRELSQSNRLASLGQLISNVSHEIRNPLAALSSALHALRREYEPRNSEAEIFEDLTHQIDRIEKTVNHLLRYARQAPPRFEIQDLQGPIQGALALAGPYLQKSQILVKVEKEATETRVLGDTGLLQQVFLNLILNAAQAMPRGGDLTLRIRPAQDEDRKASLDAEGTTDPGLAVVVQDTGQGIAEEDLTKIFQPFFTTRKDGTGLGLSVVRGIMKDHRGGIRIESVPGRGTRVTLVFPRLEASTQASPAPHFQTCLSR